MSDLGNFLGKISGKIVNVTNSDRDLKCSICNQITPHISISYADFLLALDMDKDNDNDINKFSNSLMGFVNDFIPINPAVMGNSYSCKKCRKIIFHGGISSALFNDKHKDLYL